MKIGIRISGIAQIHGIRDLFFAVGLLVREVRLILIPHGPKDHSGPAGLVLSGIFDSGDATPSTARIFRELHSYSFILSNVLKKKYSRSTVAYYSRYSNELFLPGLYSHFFGVKLILPTGIPVTSPTSRTHDLFKLWHVCVFFRYCGTSSFYKNFQYNVLLIAFNKIVILNSIYSNSHITHE